MAIPLRRLAAALRALPAAVEREVMAAEAETLAYATWQAERLSQGRYKTAQLRRMYNPRGPYSRAAPHPPADPAIINEQTGEFRRSWRQDAPRRVGGVIHSRIYNDAPYSGYLRGTRRMMERPITARIAERIRVRRKRRLETAMRRAVRSVLKG